MACFSLVFYGGILVFLWSILSTSNALSLEKEIEELKQQYVIFLLNFFGISTE